MRNFCRLILTILFIFSSPLAAETLVVDPQKDNTLFEDSQGRFSNGAGQYLFMGRTGGDNGVDELLRRTLLHFDLSEIPQNSEIINVELVLTIDKVPLGSTGGISTIHRLQSDWGESSSNAPGPEGQGTAAATGDATWLHTFHASSTWQTAGGDFNETASQSANFSASPQALVFSSSAGLITDVQAWVNEPVTNFGWIILGDEPAVQNARRFLSREHSNETGRPKLTIEYTPALEDATPVPAIDQTGLLLLIIFTLLAVKRYGRLSVSA